MITTGAFKSGHLIAQWIVYLLKIGIVLEIVFWIFETTQRNRLEEVQANNGLQLILGILGFLIFVSTAILFIKWVHLTSRNLSAFGIRNLKFSPEWAVWGFIVPILSFFRPFQVVREIWKASDPGLTDESSWQELPTPPFIKWWWGLFLFSISGIMIDGVIIQGGFIVSIVAALLAIRVVTEIDQRQEKKVEYLLHPELRPRANSSASLEMQKANEEVDQQEKENRRRQILASTMPSEIKEQLLKNLK